MGSFVSREELLKQNPNVSDVSINRVGLMAWKFHSFLSPDDNHELHKINKNCLLNAKNDKICSAIDALVIRNLFPELDYEVVNDEYRINRTVDCDRKDSIIYGFGALSGVQPKKVEVNIKTFRYDDFISLEKAYEFNNVSMYFSWFNPFIVLNRMDECSIKFDVKGKFKLYGMTSEALGANVVG